MKKLLILGGSDTENEHFRMMLASCYDLIFAEAATGLTEQHANQRVDAILVPLGSGGPPLLHAAVNSRNRLSPNVPVVGCGPSDRPEMVVECVRLGADSYLALPLPETAIQTLAGILHAKTSLVREQPHRAYQPAQTYTADGAQKGYAQLLYGDSLLMQQLRIQITRYARNDHNVLIVGETGTGKELAARALHGSSKRAGQAFIAQDCASLPENLAESILFGAERWAYTGSSQHKGLFETARSGTIFLDELAELPLAVQAKLLRALESREASRLGSHTPVPFDVRILSATNHRGLRNRNQFRQDLLNRLDTLVLEMPPLRRHPEDIPCLVRHFLETNTSCGSASHPRQYRLSEQAMGRLMEWRWPGNVRELKHVIERACVLADEAEIIEEEHIRIDCLAGWSDQPPSLL